MPESRACSSSPGPSGEKVSLTLGFSTYLFFCFMLKVFSTTLSGPGIPSQSFRISFMTSIFSSARTLPDSFTSSNLSSCVPCSTMMERACWKSPSLSGSVCTTWSPAFILMNVTGFVELVNIAWCTRIIISNSSNGSVPVMRRSFLQQSQSRILQRQHCMMPQIAAIAINGPSTMPQAPSESPIIDLITKPIILDRYGTFSVEKG
mmetsp:Transcript_81713/g.264777  ORF Transcript_81713/g.264777 Transcript_81713/m.264777 type:complete len:205 (-) Transcript_81713:36-650(-)